jgi:hypothetical protein
MFASAPDGGGRYGKHPDLYLILQSQKTLGSWSSKIVLLAAPCPFQKGPLEFSKCFPSDLLDRNYLNLLPWSFYFTKIFFFSLPCLVPDLLRLQPETQIRLLACPTLNNKQFLKCTNVADPDPHPLSPYKFP